MNVLVTGNLGYIGTVLTKKLIDKKIYNVIGFDIGYFEKCLFDKIDYILNKQIIKDIRNINPNDLKNIDCIIHLAGLSNDPLGELDPLLTNKINYSATINLAILAKKAGVKRFIYASSQSMYGISGSDIELDEYQSEKKPVTIYAKTKWEAEIELFKLKSDNFHICAFRPSTVFGVSPRLRSDIVFNNLVACAFTTNKIEIKSDGTPWRPVVHIQDVCSAFIAGIEAPLELISGKSFNVGILNGNYTVKELAEAAQRAVPGSELIFTGEHGSDSRSYKVSFNKILSELKSYYVPKWNLDSGALELVNFFKKINLKESDFRGSNSNRLLRINQLRDQKFIDSQLNIIY